jgi:hypothetical protein
MGPVMHPGIRTRRYLSIKDAEVGIRGFIIFIKVKGRIPV